MLKLIEKYLQNHSIDPGAFWSREQKLIYIRVYVKQILHISWILQV
jgi:hypothetical protein